MSNLTENDNNIWYKRIGQGHPVIFLHAFAVTSAMWFPQVPVFSMKECEVICVDLRGHGQSSGLSGSSSISQMAKDLHHLIKKLKIDDAYIVGLSMGGRVAMRLALDFPQDVSKLVLVSAKSEPAREIQHELETLATRAENGDVGSAVTEWYGAHYQRLAELAPKMTSTLIEKWQTKPGSDFAGAARALFEMETMTARVSKIDVPTLAVAGSFDTPCHPFLAWFERTIPNCRGVIVPDAGHFVNIEKTEYFNNLLLSFLFD